MVLFAMTILITTSLSRTDIIIILSFFISVFLFQANSEKSFTRRSPNAALKITPNLTAQETALTSTDTPQIKVADREPK